MRIKYNFNYNTHTAQTRSTRALINAMYSCIHILYIYYIYMYIIYIYICIYICIYIYIYYTQKILHKMYGQRRTLLEFTRDCQLPRPKDRKVRYPPRIPLRRCPRVRCGRVPRLPEPTVLPVFVAENQPAQNKYMYINTHTHTWTHKCVYSEREKVGVRERGGGGEGGRERNTSHHTGMKDAMQEERRTEGHNGIHHVRIEEHLPAIGSN
jgi:hypothetical protein